MKASKKAAVALERRRKAFTPGSGVRMPGSQNRKKGYSAKVGRR